MYPANINHRRSIQNRDELQYVGNLTRPEVMDNVYDGFEPANGTFLPAQQTMPPLPQPVNRLKHYDNLPSRLKNSLPWPATALRPIQTDRYYQKAIMMHNEPQYDDRLQDYGLIPDHFTSIAKWFHDEMNYKYRRPKVQMLNCFINCTTAGFGSFIYNMPEKHVNKHMRCLIDAFNFEYKPFGITASYHMIGWNTAAHTRLEFSPAGFRQQPASLPQ